MLHPTLNPSPDAPRHLRVPGPRSLRARRASGARRRRGCAPYDGAMSEPRPEHSDPSPDSGDPAPADPVQDGPEEAAALDAADAGDFGPFGRLLERCSARLERIAAARLDRRVNARVDASDVVQDVFVQAVKRLPRYLEQRSACAPNRLPLFLWLRMMVREGVVQVHRTHLGVGARDASLEHRLGGGDADASVTSAHFAHLLVGRHTTPTRALARSQRETTLADALEQLSDSEREVIVLRHFEGLSNGEIARLLGLTESGASIRHVRALKRLRAVAARSSIGLEELAD